MTMARVFILLSVILFSVCLTEQAYFLQNDYINKVNEEAETWKAGPNFDPNTPASTIINMLGSKGIIEEGYTNVNTDKYKIKNEVNHNWFRYIIPKTFDARLRWWKCKSIREVRDQGNCGSCWALATSSAFADRLCIGTHGKFNELLSAEELTFCCKMCGSGCKGGYPIDAWQYFSDNGLVTGGNYNTTDGCQPYKVPPCPYLKNGTNSCRGKPTEKRHKCSNQCYGNTNIEFYDDHKYTRDFYHLTYDTIQRDVFLYGPVAASFKVYSDFVSYKSGVYVRTQNATYLGGHAVKLIGWGEEKGVPYWLMVNSWNEGWGDKGLFKIRRGTNECMVDLSTTAGVPVVDD